jgi:DNA invertase Pin-like site-specific DNA recombinase
MIKAALYTRKSTTDKQKNSLEVQVSNMRQYCEGHFEIVHQFEDMMTGRVMDRPGLNEALIWLKEDSERVLIVYKVDRLSRTIDDFKSIRRFIETGRIKFMDMHAPTAKADLLTIQIKLTLAEHESKMIGQRISNTIKHLQSQGVVWGQSKSRMSQIREMGNLKRSTRSDMYAVEVLKRVARINPNGDMTLKTICENLNFFKFPTPRGGEWKPSYLCQMIKRAEKRGLRAA